MTNPKVLKKNAGLSLQTGVTVHNYRRIGIGFSNTILNSDLKRKWKGDIFTKDVCLREKGFYYDNTFVVVIVAGVIFVKGNIAPTGSWISIVNGVFAGNGATLKGISNLDKIYSIF
jgi:hypothetical protein